MVEALHSTHKVLSLITSLTREELRKVVQAWESEESGSLCIHGQTDICTKDLVKRFRERDIDRQDRTQNLG